MLLTFHKAKWIWAQKEAEKDEYVEFFNTFSYDGEGSVTVNISADSNYTMWINGSLAGFGQYADYPTYKVGDRIDITSLLVRGENRIAITVWYFGNSSQTYTPAPAGLCYEVQSGDRVLAFSSEATCSRLSPTYVAGECKSITSQLGYSYHYDNRCGDAYPNEMGAGFAASRAVSGISERVHARPVKRLTLEERVMGELVQQGTFAYGARTASLGYDMEVSALSLVPLRVMSGSYDRAIREGLTLSAEGGDGVYFIVDLGREEVGFFDMDIEVDTACRIDIGYGEHLTEGRCRTGVGKRDFSAAFEATAGRNQYLNTFRRFGCRYLQIFVHASRVTIGYVGLRPTRYPLTYKQFSSGNLLRDRIYFVAQRTLDCCMHEHYEDCPWREQALYTMDSRNQMLCGYYAFGEKDFPRASLRLIAEGQRPDGLLSICYPSGSPICIPSFSLVYFRQMREYLEYTGDSSLIEECYPVLSRILDAFEAQMTPMGVIREFGEKSCWNFYEWSPSLHGRHGEESDRIESPLNAFYVMALRDMAVLCRAVGREKEAEGYLLRAEKLRAAIKEVFFDPSVGLFQTIAGEAATSYDVLTQSLCVLCGAAEGLDIEKLCRVLETNGAAELGLALHADTLSMSGFRYDALLMIDREGYRETILQEIDRTYLEMLCGGATTFWETALGERDFSDAGSLCHGWSAMPIYYYEILS